MSRVKMNAKHEYEFVANFKVLQNAFKAKKIDKARQSSVSLHLYLGLMLFLAHTHRKACEMQDAVRTLVGSITLQMSVTGSV